MDFMAKTSFLDAPKMAFRCFLLRNFLLYNLGVLLQVCRFTEYQYTPLTVSTLLGQSPGGVTVDIVACVYEFNQFVKAHEHLYFNIYFWMRILFVHFIPCISLVILNGWLIKTMRNARTR